VRGPERGAGPAPRGQPPIGHRTCAALLWALLLHGCGDDPAETPRGASDPGYIVTLEPALDGASALRIASEPSLVLGQTDRPGHAFGTVVGAVRLPDGGLAVLDQMSSALSFFAPDGAWLRSVGGPGDGPGEFRRPVALRLAPDGSLEVEDRAGLTRFGADGTLLDTERTDYAGLALRVPGRRFSWDCYLTPAYVDPWRLIVPCNTTPGAEETGPHPVKASLYRFDDQWQEPTLIGELVDQVPWWFRYRGATGYMSTWAFVPFWTRGVFAVGTMPPRLVHARSDQYAIGVIDLDTGTEAFRIERPDRRIAPDPFHQAHEWAEWEEWADGFRTIGQAVGTPAIDRQLEELRAMIPMPDSIEHVAALLVADDGSIWVRWTPTVAVGGGKERIWRYVEQGHLDGRWLDDRPTAGLWDVYDADGRFQNTLELLFNLHPTHIGDGFVLGVMRGDMGTELVALFQLHGGS